MMPMWADSEPMADPNMMAAQDALAMVMQQAQQEQAQQAATEAVAQDKRDLHAYLKEWLAKAMMHRRANYEHKWDRWRRNANSIYDPARKARKESWQSTFFTPLTLQNKEIIKSNLYRTLVNDLPYSVRPRPSGDYDQAQSIRDLTIREMQRSQFAAVANDVMDDLTIYGTGFMKRVWYKETRKRKVRVPIIDTSMGAIAGLQQGQMPQTTGYQSQIEDREVYRGVKAWAVSIWDLFFPEGASNIKTTSLCQRVRVTYQSIVKGVQEGYYFPEAAEALRDVKEDISRPSPDKQGEASDKNLSIVSTPKTDYSKIHTLFEFSGDLPQKWVYCRPEDQQLITDPEELVPAKAIFNADALCSIDESNEYDGSPPFDSCGYVVKPGEIYHMGICEMLEQIQDDTNETTNQRKDNVNLVMNRMFAIMEQAIVSRADLVSRPGGGIRIKKGSTDDVRKAFMWTETPDVTQSSYVETSNNERFAQELTGATRVTIGSGGNMARDVTQTKGGMELLRTSANERFTYYAMVIEQAWISQAVRGYYTLIYNNIQPEDLFAILGPQRAMMFKLLTPEEVDRDYYWAPEGVFSTTHQPIRIQQWQAFRDQLMGAPFWNDVAYAQTMAKAIELPNTENIIRPIRDPQTGEVVPFEVIQQAMLMAGANPQAGPGKASAADTKPRMNDKKPGKNENTETSS